jgi:hypothetical protein
MAMGPLIMIFSVLIVAAINFTLEMSALSDPNKMEVMPKLNRRI